MLLRRAVSLRAACVRAGCHATPPVFSTQRRMATSSTKQQQGQQKGKPPPSRRSAFLIIGLVIVGLFLIIYLPVKLTLEYFGYNKTASTGIEVLSEAELAALADDVAKARKEVRLIKRTTDNLAKKYLPDDV
ncbi:hypothetical protein DIPPA_03669 [Diplonema papillatum]|nr:hypothetical protein DIPPA_03669 [Diplonema papillatum]